LRGGKVLSHALRGAGEPLVLLNGGMMTYASWEPLAASLAERYRVVLCDFRGQLLTPGDAPRTLEGHVEDVVALLDHQGIDRPHMVGASFGAEVALLVAADHPGRAHSVVAITAADRADSGLLEGVTRLRTLVRDIRDGGDRAPFWEELVSEVYSPAFAAAHRDELAERGRQTLRLPDAWFTGLEGILDCLRDLDLTHRLPAVQCPALVVTAGRDRVIARERSRALAAALPGAVTAEHPESGHALVVEDPEWLAETCLAFLEQIDRGPATAPESGAGAAPRKGES
jgi:3-oxoadipate enol-lactonase